MLERLKARYLSASKMFVSYVCKVTDFQMFLPPHASCRPWTCSGTRTASSVAAVIVGWGRWGATTITTTYTNITTPPPLPPPPPPPPSPPPHRWATPCTPRGTCCCASATTWGQHPPTLPCKFGSFLSSFVGGIGGSFLCNLRWLMGKTTG